MGGNPLKKPLFFTAALIALDQAVKLLISKSALNASMVLIPGTLLFKPTQNTHLNWIASMAGYKTPVWMMITLQIVVLVLVTLLFRYLTYRSGSRQPLLLAFFTFVAAGIGCSFIDVVFWGGSLDFLGLFSWFVFDTKDIYLNTSSVFLVLWVIKNEKGKEHRLRSSETNLHMLTNWFRQGCPMRPADDNK